MLHRCNSYGMGTVLLNSIRNGRGGVMKRLLLTTVSALALISARPGLAADLPTRMPIKAAPAPARVFSWTGCYLGGHVGWGWGRKTFADTPDGDLVEFFTGGDQTSLDLN